MPPRPAARTRIRKAVIACAAGWVVIALAARADIAAAQATATAPMGQGEANINVRSDVRLEIKGIRATISERLDQLTEVVTDQMGPIRKCYRELIAKRPTTVGSLAIRITLEAGNEPPLFELKENGGTEPDLTSCVRRQLERASFRTVGRPAAAIATLQFANTRAKGEAEMQQRIEAQERVELRDRTGGGVEAGWASSDGKVGFTVGSAAGSREAVEAAMRTLRAGFAGFADCRRRSEKGGLSPAGELSVELQLQRGGKSSAKVKSSSVAHERAVPCVERTFSKLRFEDAPAGQRVDVRVTFGS